MAIKQNFTRRFAWHLMIKAQSLAPPQRQEWARAMLIEFELIASDNEAFAFALGCYETLWRQMMIQEKLISLLTPLLGIILFAWAGAKIYLGFLLWQTHVTTAQEQISLWLWVGVISAALLYSGAAFSIFTRRYIEFAICFLGALGTNALLFIAGSLATHPNNFMLALAGEDYFVWTGVLLLTAIIPAIKYFPNNSPQIRK